MSQKDNVIEYVKFPADVTIEEFYINTAPEVQLRCFRFTPSNPKTKRQFVFIPGWISELESWRYFLPNIAQHMEVVYLETREKRTSNLPPKSVFTIEAIQEDVLHFLENKDLVKEDYILSGSSMGATVVLEIMSQLKRAPSALVLILPNSRFSIPKTITLLKIMPIPLFTAVKKLVMWFILKFRVNPDDKDHQDAFIRQINQANMFKLRDSALSFQKYNMDWDILRKINLPSLVVGARKDNLHQKDVVRDMAESIPEATFKDMKDFTATHSSKCAQLVISWLGND